MNDVCIRVNNVHRRFDNKTVLHGITLDIRRSEIFGFLGPSGSGKTTLVKMMAGIDKPTIGHVELLGTRLPKLSMMTRIGYMAQNDALYAELTARENLEFFGSLFGLRGQSLKRRISEVMELVNLGEHLNELVINYSGGMKRRLSLAIALLHKPEVLILDEPTVGIDPLLRQSIWNELHRQSRQGVTIIVTTHVMDEADRCRRLGMIRDGRLIASGTVSQLKEQSGTSTIEEAFLHFGGVPA